MRGRYPRGKGGARCAYGAAISLLYKWNIGIMSVREPLTETHLPIFDEIQCGYAFEYDILNFAIFYLIIN